MNPSRIAEIDLDNLEIELVRLGYREDGERAGVILDGGVESERMSCERGRCALHGNVPWTCKACRTP